MKGGLIRTFFLSWCSSSWPLSLPLVHFFSSICSFSIHLFLRRWFGGQFQGVGWREHFQVSCDWETWFIFLHFVFYFGKQSSRVLSIPTSFCKLPSYICFGRCRCSTYWFSLWWCRMAEEEEWRLQLRVSLESASVGSEGWMCLAELSLLGVWVPSSQASLSGSGLLEQCRF